MERFLNTLGTIAAVGPLLGLLGTVVGMIQMFLRHPDHGVGDANQLAGGIGKALVCTAAGMFVAIPALMFHRYFRGRIADYVVDMEKQAISLLDALDEGEHSPRVKPIARAKQEDAMNLGRDRGDDEPEINLISLIDVLFCLIIFFVVTTTFDQRSMLKLQLPQAQAAAESEPGEPLMVLIDAEGRYFVGSSEVLKNSVADAQGSHRGMARGSIATCPVVLRADARTPHQAVITAMDALGQLGFTKVQLATTPEPKKQ